MYVRFCSRRSLSDVVSRGQGMKNFWSPIARNFMSLLLLLSLFFDEMDEPFLTYSIFFACEFVEEGLSGSMGLIVHELTLLIICAK